MCQLQLLVDIKYIWLEELRVQRHLINRIQFGQTDDSTLRNQLINITFIQSNSLSFSNSFSFLIICFHFDCLFRVLDTRLLVWTLLRTNDDVLTADGNKPSYRSYALLSAVLTASHPTIESFGDGTLASFVLIAGAAIGGTIDNTAWKLIPPADGNILSNWTWEPYTPTGLELFQGATQATDGKLKQI